MGENGSVGIGVLGLVGLSAMTLEWRVMDIVELKE